MEETPIGWNGFYSLKKLDLKTLHKFMREAVKNASFIKVDHIAKGEVARIINYDMSIDEIIKNYLSLNTHNTAVDRKAYGDMTGKGEIGFSTLSGDSVYLFIYLGLDKFNKLVKKYKLKKK